MKAGSLFAGIGGFDLGLERAGIPTAWQVEIEPRCRSVLRRHFPAALQAEDIETLRPGQLERVDVITGGFPCQDVSVAGARAGLAGDRTGLFYRMMEVIDGLRPAWVVWENVPGLLSSPPPERGVPGSDFLAVITALDELGYGGAWTIVDAQHFGLAQLRRRIFGVFASGHSGARRAGEILAIAARLPGNPAPRRSPQQDPSRTIEGGSNGYSKSRLAYTLRSADGPHGRDNTPIVAVSENQRAEVRLTERAFSSTGGGGKPGQGYAAAMTQGWVRRLTPRECERLQGFPDDWTARGVDGPISDSRRYAMLGNAVPPPCAEWIARRLVAEVSRGG
jgi:DNA (cytosine-5)-methyltransferase 1